MNSPRYDKFILVQTKTPIAASLLPPRVYYGAAPGAGGGGGGVPGGDRDTGYTRHYTRTGGLHQYIIPPLHPSTPPPFHPSTPAPLHQGWSGWPI